jgi:hypothetical protein
LQYFEIFRTGGGTIQELDSKLEVMFEDMPDLFQEYKQVAQTTAPQL